MKKNDLKNFIRESLRTRFMFEKENDTEEDQEPLNEPSTAPQETSIETPHEKALQMGLIDKKFGRYADPQTNKIVAKIIDGNLTQVEPQDAEEDMQAQEPSLSGFNYNDPYGEDYPKPKNQLGAVPPVFKPVTSAPKDDTDFYANPGKLTGPSGRTSRYGIGKITGNPGDTKNSVSIASNWSPDDKHLASSGGAGTYKDAGRQGAIIRTSPDGTEMTWSQDGPLKTYDNNDKSKEQGDKVALVMIKKYGRQTALSKAQKQLGIEEDRFKQLASHNSNSSGERLKKLENMQFTIDRLRHCVTSLQGAVTEALIVEITQAGEEAKQLGLLHKGWGRYADKTGKIVAKSVNGKLIKLQPSKNIPNPSKKKQIEAPSSQEAAPEQDATQDDSQVDKQGLTFLIKEKGMSLVGRKPSKDNEPRRNPGWNKQLLHAEVEFDANADETVARLMEMFHGDTQRLMKWLLKKYKMATPSGKKRLKQYMLIVLKDVKQNSRGQESGEKKRDPEIDGLFAM